MYVLWNGKKVSINTVDLEQTGLKLVLNLGAGIEHIYNICTYICIYPGSDAEGLSW